MPLPFLKPKTVAGLIISQRKPDGGKEEMHDEGDENQGLEAAAEDLLRAITSKDPKHLALALQNFMDISSSGSSSDSSEESNDYDSLNEKAAREGR